MAGCEVCAASGKLFQCARCRRAFYCSKEHQTLHWKQHKLQCNVKGAEVEIPKGSCKKAEVNSDDVLSSPTTSPVLVEQLSQRLQSSDSPLVTSTLPDCKEKSRKSRRRGSKWRKSHPDCVVPHNGAEGEGNEKDKDKDTAVHDKDGSDVATGDEPNRCASATAAALTPLYPPPYQHRNARLGGTPSPNTPGWLQTMCRYVINDMNSHGICVIDNFMGPQLCAAILAEVLDMYESGRFVDGKLMSNTFDDDRSRAIRGDKIHWVTGQEEHCKGVGHLVRLVDSILLGSNRMPNNGKLGQYDISDRTKAMVACYPGDGAAYVKHVDNPNRDGRCVTSIYYLNKNWDVKKDGGLLRIFPRDWSHVADIEPLFDRLIFFWSDRRNPHEVQPSLRTRYAITLWYHDKPEREAALKAGQGVPA